MKVGVVGSGTMGCGLVQLFAQSCEIDRIYWVSRSNESKEKAFYRLKDAWEVLVLKGKFTASEVSVFWEKITGEANYEILQNAEFVIEAVSENIEAKKIVLGEASKFIPDNTIYASNTSSLSITEIASVSNLPQNVIGLHFFNPAPIMSLTEIVLGIKTSDESKNFALKLSKLLRKKPVVVNEAPGFIVNRMLIPMINEAIGILGDGVATAIDIDEAMKNGANHPIGPLALADMIGNDVCLSIMEVLHSETGDPKYRANPLLRKMVRAGLLGRKTRSGFFNYK